MFCQLRLHHVPAIAAVLVGIGARPAFGDPVLAFVTIAGDLAPQYFVLDKEAPVGLDGSGVVVFTARVDLGGPTRPPGVFSGRGGPITTIASPADADFTLATLPAISDNGRVVFLAELDGLRAIVRRDGPGPPTLIIKEGSSTEPIQLSCVRGCGVANDGTAIFTARPSGGNDGIYVGSGGPIFSVSPFSTNVQFPDINNVGGVAYRSGPMSNAIVSGLPGPLKVLIEGSGPFAYVGPLSLNDHGSVSFSGQLDNDVRGVFQVNSQGDVSTIVDSTGAFRHFAEVSSNNSGGVAFIAHADIGNGVGVYRGADPVAGKIVAVGDQIDGKTVAEIVLGRNALNDSGSVAFTVSFTDGTNAVIRADPLIELGVIDPASLNKYVQLSTVGGTSVVLSQLVPLPMELFDLGFDLEFLTSSGELEVMLGDVLLGTFVADDAGSILLEDLDPKALFRPAGSPPDDLLLRFLLSGPAGSTLRIDNVLFPGVVNGTFQVGYFDAWMVDTSGGGVAFVSALETTSVPEPGSLALVGLAAALCAFRKRRRAG
jgi:hypothetical protein